MVDLTFPLYTYDDDLLETTRRDGRTRVRVYRLTDTVVVAGSGCKPELELNLAACEADGIPILKRRGGGCSVVLDPGNVIVSVVATGVPFGHHRQHFDGLAAWLIDGLAKIGVLGVQKAGICDLVIDNRKVAGACLHRSRDLLYYSTSLLVKPGLSKVDRYLKHPPREPEYRRGRPHEAFMGSIAMLSGLGQSGDPAKDLDTEWIATQLRQVLQPPDLATSPRA